MSAAVVILPVIWATEDIYEVRGGGNRDVAQMDVRRKKGPASVGVVEQRQSGSQRGPELAFYRKYTEGLLRRYVKMAMEAGKVPSLLGKEMFRGKVTNYRVQGFDDVVIFVHDVEKCLAKLDTGEHALIERIGLQEYTLGEAAELLGVPLRTLIRRYARALDVLTEIFLERKLLEPLTACQEGERLL